MPSYCLSLANHSYGAEYVLSYHYTPVYAQMSLVTWALPLIPQYPKASLELIKKRCEFYYYVN